MNTKLLQRGIWLRWVLGGILALIVAAAYAETPTRIRYAGRVAVDGVNVTGTRAFKFAIVSGQGPLWNNQSGTAVPLELPSTVNVDPVDLAVVNGRFTVMLGDTGLANMTDLGHEVFIDEATGEVRSNVSLRVWFSEDGVDFHELTPEVPLVSVPYALVSGFTQDLKDRSVIESKLADGAVISSHLSPAFYQGQWSELGGQGFALDLEAGTITATVDFRRPFGVVPTIDVPGWTVTRVDKSGFVVTRTAGFESRVVAGEGYRPVLSLVAGRPAMCYEDGAIKYVRARDAGGEAWGTSHEVAVGSAPSLAVLSNGRPAVAFRRQDDFFSGTCFTGSLEADGTFWTRPMTVSGPLEDTVSPSLALVDGSPAISYHSISNDQQSTGDLMFAIADDASGTSWGNPVTVESVGIAGYYSALAVVDGRPAISYYNSLHGQRFVIAEDPRGAIWGAPVTVDGAGGSGGSSLVVVGGHPAVAYRHSASGEARFAIATDAGGSDWESPVAVAPGVGVGGETISLAVVGGRPAIGFLDGDTLELKYVMADDETGASWGAPTTVDGEAEGVALADVNGFPAFGHLDVSNGVLKFTTVSPGTGGWTAIDPEQDPVLAGRAVDVVDGSVTGAGLEDGAIDATHLSPSIGLWSSAGNTVFVSAESVGIGTSFPMGKLTVIGTAGNDTGVWSQFSDRRLKENVAPMVPGSLERLMRLEGVRFDYTDSLAGQGYRKHQVGWIAQDVERVFPEWISEAPNGMKMVAPVGFNALLVEGLRELRAGKDEGDAELATALSELTAKRGRTEDRSASLDREDAALRRRLDLIEDAVKRRRDSEAPTDSFDEKDD